MLTRYDEWWDEFMPAAQEHKPIVIGDARGNLTWLSPCDWNEVHCDNPACYRAAAALEAARRQGRQVPLYAAPLACCAWTECLAE